MLKLESVSSCSFRVRWHRDGTLFGKVARCLLGFLVLPFQQPARSAPVLYTVLSACLIGRICHLLAFDQFPFLPSHDNSAVLLRPMRFGCHRGGDSW